jgi:hypothetical protein
VPTSEITVNNGHATLDNNSNENLMKILQSFITARGLIVLRKFVATDKISPQQTDSAKIYSFG